MKKLISAATALTMAATMVSSIAPTVVFAADAKKGFSIEAYKDGESKYSAMGNAIAVSKDDITAGDVKIPCAIYLDETTNDMNTIAVSCTVVSDAADAKNIKFNAISPEVAYFPAEKDFPTGISSDCTVTFAGSYSSREGFVPAGKYFVASDDSQSAAGTDKAYFGVSWTNNGETYEYLGSKSSDYPVAVFDVTLPKGLSEGAYVIDFCKYNTDTTGQYDNPTPMIEITGGRYTVANSNLDLTPLTIKVGEGSAPVATTTQPPVTTTTTTKAPEQVATTTVGNPGSSNAEVVFDLGNYTAKAGEKIDVDIKVDAKGANLACTDINLAIEAPLMITEILKKSPAINGTVSSNIDALTATFTNLDTNGDPKGVDATKAAYMLSVEVPAGTADGTYKLSLTKHEAFKNGGGDEFSTDVINGNIVVSGGTPAGTTAGTTAPTTATSTATDPVATTTTKTPGQSSNAEVVFDLGNYTAKAGEKIDVDIKIDAKDKTVASVDINLAIDSPLKITEILKKSPAINGTVSSNIDELTAIFTNLDTSGDPKGIDSTKAAFMLSVEVPAGTADGTYKLSLTKHDAYVNGGGAEYTTDVINGNIVVSNGDTPATTTQPTVSTTTTIQTPPATTTATTAIGEVSTTTVSTPVATGSLKPVWGDTNCDGTVNVADVVVLNKWLNNNASIAITDQGKVNADCCNPQDASGAAVDPAKVDLTAADSDAIIRSVVHLITLPTQG